MRIIWFGLLVANQRLLLFALENNGDVRDPHWFRVHPCIHFPENLRELAVLLFRSNIPASVIRHEICGKRSLVRDPTRIKRYKSTSHLQGAMSKPNTIHSIFIVQVVQNGDRYHNIGIFKSRVAPKRSRVANYKGPLVAVRPPGKRNVIWVNVEPKIFDAREALQSLRWTAPDIDHFIPSPGAGMVLNDPPPQRVPSNDTLKQVVEKWHFQPAQ